MTSPRDLETSARVLGTRDGLRLAERSREAVL